MKNTLSLFLLIYLIIGFPLQSIAADTEADISAIRDILNNQYPSAVNSADLNTWMSLWADDAIRMAPNVLAARGKKEIQASAPVQALFILYTTKMAVTTEEIQVVGDWAFGRGNFTYMMTPKSEGETLDGAGKFLTIFERQSDGTWKFARDCFNENFPPSQ